MAKYEYTYESGGVGIMILNIILPYTSVFMAMDETNPDHATMIQLFQNQTKLEKYVDYLGDDPNRPFNLQEIINL